MIRKLMALLRPSRRELQEAAIKRACGLHGDVEAARLQVHYYAKLLRKCDPWQDWWTFAHLRQEWSDADQELQRAWGLYERAKADVDALMGANGDG